MSSSVVIFIRRKWKEHSESRQTSYNEGTKLVAQHGLTEPVQCNGKRETYTNPAKCQAILCNHIKRPSPLQYGRGDKGDNLPNDAYLIKVDNGSLLLFWPWSFEWHSEIDQKILVNETTATNIFVLATLRADGCFKHRSPGTRERSFH